MNQPTSQSARQIALKTLFQFDPKTGRAADILERFIDQTSEKQRATDLVLGTVRNRLLLDYLIQTFSGTPLKRIQRKILNLLRPAVYELIFSPRTPVYSILNEWVELSKINGSKKQAGFINAVLRKISDHIKARDVQFDHLESNIVPQSDKSGCEFDLDVLPDIKLNEVEYYSVAFSLPDWLIRSWIESYGQAKAQQIAFASNRQFSIYLRINPLKTTKENLMVFFNAQSVEFEDVADIPFLKIVGRRNVANLPGFSDGLFSVQDLTAYQAVCMLDPQPKEKILDLCAAPGTKTLQLAEVTDDTAEIYATDIHPKRLAKVIENIERLGVSNVRTIDFEDVEKIATRIGLFDAVLIDVPCSNTGVLARRPEARYRLNPQRIRELVQIQSDLIDRAAAMIKPGGRLCYSTCSIQHRENLSIIQNFLKRHRNFEQQDEKITLPDCHQPDHDGGYVAVMIKQN